MGHATRSKGVIDFLLEQNHNAHIVSSSRAFNFLNNEFPERVTEIKGLHFTYKNAKISKSITLILKLKSAGKNFIYNIGKELAIKKPFSEKGFIQDLSSTKVVITNGGFSFISEAVYLKNLFILSDTKSI